MRGWITSLAYRFMNVQCFSVHHRSMQHPSKANTVHVRVTSNAENVPRVGVNLRGSNATTENMVATFVNIMIMYSLHNNNENYPGPDMDKAYVLVHSI